MARTRERRRRGIAIARARIGPIERKKLIALGYLESDVDHAATAYLSDKLVEESVAVV